MKKIFKLFLCLLMLVSFTNIAKALGEENYVSALDVANNFNKTNLIEGLLIEARREDPDASLDISIDEENHTFSIVDDEEESEFEMVFHYNDEYISYTGKTVETPEDVDFGRAMAESVYLENLILSVLDTMDYNDVEIQVDDEFEPNEEFYNQYGILVETQDYSFEDEDGSLSGTSIKEFRISLDKTKIASAVEKYGMERTDYVKLFSSILHTPELTVKKKGANVVVSWPEDENATSFIVYRADKRDGKYTKLGTVKTNSYTDKKVKYGKTYYYKVKAVGENESLTSEIVKFKVAPAKVKNVKVSSVKSTSVKISYDKLSETGYVIERSTDNKKWTVVKTITKNSTLSFNSTGLKANKTYYFRVRAYKSVSGKKVYGGYSDVVSVRTAPSAPKFTIANDTFQSLKLSITGVKGASKYIIYRSTSKKRNL